MLVELSLKDSVHVARNLGRRTFVTVKLCASMVRGRFGQLERGSIVYTQKNNVSYSCCDFLCRIMFVLTTYAPARILLLLHAHRSPFCRKVLGIAGALRKYPCPVHPSQAAVAGEESDATDR